MRRVRDAEGQTVLNIDGSLPSRMSGPPLHVHFYQREEFFVKAGSLGVQIGNEKSIVPTGAVGLFPTGVAHTWWNAGDDLLELSGRATPAGDLDRYLQAAFAVLNSSPSSRPSVFYIAHVLWRHRHTQALVSPPRFVQVIVSRSFFLSDIFWASIAETTGPVRLSRVPVRPRYKAIAHRAAQPASFSDRYLQWHSPSDVPACIVLVLNRGELWATAVSRRHVSC
jgi:Cupin domain